MEKMDVDKKVGEKILIFGDVLGNYERLFIELEWIWKNKCPYKYIFCLGDFFGSDPRKWKALFSGSLRAPVEIYVASSTVCLEKPKEIPNITFLGQKGIMTFRSGVKIVYLSGFELVGHIERTLLKNFCKNVVSFEEKHVDHLIKSMKGRKAEVLLTSLWPKDILDWETFCGSPKNVPKVDKCSSNLISKLRDAVDPEYHAAAVANLGSARYHVRNRDNPTFFLGIPYFGNKSYEQYFYGLELRGINNILPVDFTKYGWQYESIKYLIEGNEEFFFNIEPCVSLADKEKYKPRELLNAPVLESCKFCLAHNSEEKIIVSIGAYFYVTLSKECLVKEHVLIVPVKHLGSTVDVQVYDPAVAELQKFKEALTTYFHDNGQDVVFFEKNYLSPHLLLEVVPIPKNKREVFKRRFRSFSRKYKLFFKSVKTSFDIQKDVGKRNFFVIEIFINKESKGKYLHIISDKFPGGFVRGMLGYEIKSEDDMQTDDMQTSCFKVTGKEVKIALRMRERFWKYVCTRPTLDDDEDDDEDEEDD